MSPWFLQHRFFLLPPVNQSLRPPPFPSFIFIFRSASSTSASPTPTTRRMHNQSGSRSPFPFLFFLPALFFIAVAGPDLIKATCKKTKYVKFCIASLESDPTSGGADTKGLAAIMLNYGAAAAGNSSTYLSTPPPSLTNGSPAREKAAKLCADKYGYAKAAIVAALSELTAENYDGVEVSVLAAAEYADGCRRGFVAKGEAYPRVIVGMETKLKRVCSVVHGITQQLLQSS